MSLKSLELRLGELGRRISLSGLSKIENGERKVDVDELVVLALALDVSPVSLLLPHPSAPWQRIAVTGREDAAHDLWQWAVASLPLDLDGDEDDVASEVSAFGFRSRPWWLEVASTVTNDQVTSSDRREIAALFWHIGSDSPEERA